MLFLYLIIFCVLIWLLWWKLKTADKQTNRPVTKSENIERRNYENKVNEYINSIRCKSCNTNQIPVYKIRNDGKEIINCCCSGFSKYLNSVISSEQNQKSVNIEEINSAHHKRQQSNNIFKKIEELEVTDNLIEQEIKTYNYEIVAYYIGTLECGNQYAITIGTSDEWVNIITYNWAKNPIYKDYGFSIVESRWSYGSKVLGAPQIREVIHSNLTEIKSIMLTQEHVRQEKAERNKEENK